MNVSTSEDSLVTDSSRSVFFCPNTPQFIWDLKNTISLQLAIAVAAVACPFTIFLNVLVIVAVKKIRELQRNCNILIASLAVADLLVGAVSMPLTITVDALILRGTVSENIICTLSDITAFVLYAAYYASYYHLILIAWERYVAIVKWKEYKVILTKGRVKRYAGIAWITALITTAELFIALVFAGDRYEILLLVLSVIISLAWFISFSLMVYFYSMVYIATRKRNRSQISQVNAPIKARIESRIAFTMFLLTVLVFISGIPSLVCTLATFLPFLRANSVFRWAEIFLQINSLVNPAVYFYRNRRYRKAALQLLRFGKPQEIEPVVRMERRARRHRDSVASIDVGELVDNERVPRLTRSQSYAARTDGRWDTGHGVPDGTVMDRRMSSPYLASHDNLRDALQPVTLIVTVEIERAPRKKPVKRKTKLSNDTKKSHRRKLTRSKSLNENAFAVPTSARKKIAKVKFQRRNSAPSVLAIEKACRER